jgi:protein-disulfide isomerase
MRLLVQTKESVVLRRKQVLAGGILAVLVLAGALWSQGTKRTTPELNTAAISEKIVQYIRERFNFPATVRLSTGSFRNSPYPDFYVTTVTVDDGKEKRNQDFYVSKNGRYLIDGTIFTLGVDPKREVVQSISLRDVPSEGSPKAPVTIVEYADLACPSCALFHEFLTKQLLPKYPGKVRVVFKEFPLVTLHDWVLTGAIANQCVYQIKPQLYAPFRSLVYQRRTSLTGANVRDALIQYGEQLGIDRLRLATCIDSKATLPRVERDAREASQLGVNSTPTSYINGKMIVGAASPDVVFKAVEEALFAAQK